MEYTSFRFTSCEEVHATFSRALKQSVIVCTGNSDQPQSFFVAHVILQISNFYCDQPQSFFVTHVTVQITNFYWLAFVTSRSCESFDFPFFGILFGKDSNVSTKIEVCDLRSFLTLLM